MQTVALIIITVDNVNKLKTAVEPNTQYVSWIIFFGGLCFAALFIYQHQIIVYA